MSNIIEKMQQLSKDLIEKASKGDLEAFEVLYKLNVDFVYRVSCGLLGNQFDAQDVTQEVFLKIYKNLKNFKFRSSIKTWIYKIALNTAINAYKRLKKTKNLINYKDEIKTKDVTENLDRIDAKNILYALLDKLNQKEKMCIILKELEGLSYKEIALTLNININTVRTHLHRGREKLFKAKYEL
ncbi:MAG: RNA polymerase sigma factor [Candidatus Omnitrophica bacterium]|nr:RNA polymerase sigma factor [Candidatus Omnitrophota bacterium]